MAGDHELEEAIISHVKRTYNLMIGERTAEEIKEDHRICLSTSTDVVMEARGRDLRRAFPRTVDVRASEIQMALSEPVTSIVDAVKMTLERPAGAFRRHYG